MIGSVEIKTRPLKLAYLIDPNNSKQVREAIRLSSSLWGGKYFPIIPLYKRMSVNCREKQHKIPTKDIVIGYLEAFDPDILVQLSREVPKYISDNRLRVIKPEDIWVFLGTGYPSPIFGLGIFELLDMIYKEYFKYIMKDPISIIFPKLPKQYQLFWASFFGEIPTELYPYLMKRYGKLLEINTSKVNIEKLDALLKRSMSPLLITSYNNRVFSSSRVHQDAYVLYLDALQTEDVIDYWNLRALGKTVMPVPKQLRDNPQVTMRVFSFLERNKKLWTKDPDSLIYTRITPARSCTEEEIREYGRTLDSDPIFKEKEKALPYSLQSWFPRIWDEKGRDADGALAGDIYGLEEESIEISEAAEGQIKFRPLLPQFAYKEGFYGQPRCANEISFRLYRSDEYMAEAFIKTTGDNYKKAIGLSLFREDWRIGRNGLVRFVRSNHSETQYLPFADKILFAWLQDLGWKSELSQPGLLAKRINKELEGYPSILRNEELLKLLEHMNGVHVGRSGRIIETTRIDQERDLSVAEVKSRLRALSGSDSLHDYLVRKGFFRLGVKVQCPVCQRRNWYPLDRIDDSLTCPRCLQVFNAAGNLDSSTWSYKTAGPLSVPDYAGGAYAVLLTLNLLKNIHQISMTPSFSFTTVDHRGETFEVDFGALWQDSASAFGEKKSGLLLGECKTYGKFVEKDFKRMRDLAKAFPGSVLVFSTMRKTLNSEENLNITRIAKAGRRRLIDGHPINPVLILTGKELLDPSGPPYCWKDKARKKVGFIRDLLDMCDITQQIYLKLPSWQEERALNMKWHYSLK
jgi:hypothetical protein